MNEDDKLKLYMYSLSPNIIEDLSSIVKDLEKYGVTLTVQNIKALSDSVLEAASEDAKVKKEETSLQVCFPTADGNTTYDKNSKAYDAEIVEIGTQESKDGLTQDTAILKIDAENLVALTLSASYPESNSQVVSAGFPAVAEEIFSSVGSDASTLSVSVVTGKVARTVDIEGTKYKSIEVTTTLSNGSSGGPSVDNHLEIEGLNTYMSSTDNRFAYMVPAEFVADKTKKIDLIRDDTTKTFLTGLQMLQQNYGKSAVECFEYVKEKICAGNKRFGYPDVEYSYGALDFKRYIINNPESYISAYGGSSIFYGYPKTNFIYETEYRYTSDDVNLPTTKSIYFEGWYLDAAYSNVANLTENPDAKINLYAK